MTGRPGTRGESPARTGFALQSIAQIARRCGVSEKTVRRWIDQREIAIHRLRHQIRISEQDFGAFLGNRREDGL